jgi:hypothetical protein
MALALCTAGCKKHPALPDLDEGNDFNSSSGVEFVKLDSSRVYNGATKTLKCYVGVKTALVNSNGFSSNRVNVYRNGISGTFLIAPTYVFIINNVLPGQIYKFEFTLVDSQGRESKKSRMYQVVI